MNGKGSRPRNCFSKQFKDNYSSINWGSKKKPKQDLMFCEYCAKFQEIDEDMCSCSKCGKITMTC